MRQIFGDKNLCSRWVHVPHAIVVEDFGVGDFAEIRIIKVFEYPARDVRQRERIAKGVGRKHGGNEE
jgi:hypothetical protein